MYLRKFIKRGAAYKFAVAWRRDSQGCIMFSVFFLALISYFPSLTFAIGCL